MRISASRLVLGVRPPLERDTDKEPISYGFTGHSLSDNGEFGFPSESRISLLEAVQPPRALVYDLSGERGSTS